jgi:ethanolaminephosphotransferase
MIATSVMVLSGIYGPTIWSTPLVSYFPSLSKVLPESQQEITFRALWIPIILTAFFTSHLPECVINVRRARSAKNLPTLPLLLEWTPMLVYCAACMAWLGSPYSNLLKTNHLVLFCLTMSLVFGRMTTKIILAHLTRQPFPYWTVMLIPLLGGAVLVNLPYIGTYGFGRHIEPVSADFEAWYLRAYFVFATVVYGRWAVLVINSICNYLGIRCLTIPPEKVEAARAARAAQRQDRLANGETRKHK